ncbi:hypothetical protein M413DRAFT_387263 [Hebeloma cylindrosporum]|uniref:Uncharacterized protein n=1 Tax=Hebeloma cylindrosporum TaxID=76867 RepID=A0A0C2YRS1_HEBCY|nr:hypothetical protein M413DRAFT_387263 [Hebeloma cylindrosporum h7]
MGTLLAELKKRSDIAVREFEALVTDSTTRLSGVRVLVDSKRVITANATSVKTLRDTVGRYKNTTEALAVCLSSPFAEVVAHPECGYKLNRALQINRTKRVIGWYRAY